MFGIFRIEDYDDIVLIELDFKNYFFMPFNVMDIHFRKKEILV